MRKLFTTLSLAALMAVSVANLKANGAPPPDPNPPPYTICWYETQCIGFSNWWPEGFDFCWEVEVCDTYW